MIPNTPEKPVETVNNTPASKLLELEGKISELSEKFEKVRHSEAVFRSVLHTATDGILCSDEKGIITFINNSALSIFGYDFEDLTGRNVMMFVPDIYLEKHKMIFSGNLSDNVNNLLGKVVDVLGKRKDGSEFPLELRISEMAIGYDRNFTVIIRDITERKYAEAERENIIRELKEALDNIKRLKGMIPICASCKKIRDDGGFWQGVESYISKHVEVDFSHSICPDCMHKLYPDFADEIVGPDSK